MNHLLITISEGGTQQLYCIHHTCNPFTQSSSDTRALEYYSYMVYVKIYGLFLIKYSIFGSFHVWLIPNSSFYLLLIPFLAQSIFGSFHFWLILAYKKPMKNHTNKLRSFYKYCVSHFDHQFTWKRKILSLSNSIIRSILNRFLYQHFLNKINVQGHNRYMRPSNHNWMKFSLNSRSCFYA